MNKLLLSLVKNSLEQYIADQIAQVMLRLKADGWVQADGSLRVPAAQVEAFGRDLGKAVVYALRHG